MNLPVWIENRMADLRYGMRMIASTPGISIIAILSLALGIGANTAIFSLVDALLLKRLPVKAPQELFMPATDERVSWNYPDYVAFRDRSGSFSGLAAYTSGARALGMQPDSAGATEIAYTQLVTGNYFNVLGVTPELGRLFTGEVDRKPGSSPYAILSYPYWLARFGGAQDIIGRTLRLNGHVFTIIGVTRNGFRGTDVTTAPQIFIPLLMYSEVSGQPFSMWNNRHYWWMQAVGRIKPGVSKGQSEAELSAILRSQVEAERKAEPDSRAGKPSPVVLRPAGSGYSNMRNRLEKPLIVLMSVVGLVLLIACANVANLMLARGAARQHEMAIRLALGATRARLITRQLVESILIALIGGAAGLALAYFGVAILLTFVPPSGETQVALEVTPDLRLLAFTFAASLLTGILFGVAPALRCTKPDLVPVLKEEVPGSAGTSRLTLRNALVVVQVALSLLLLIGAGLFVRSLGNLRSVETGFRQEQTVIVFLDPQRNGYKGQRLRDFFERLRAGAEVLPGVQSAGLAAITPLSGMQWNSDFAPEGYSWKAGEERWVNCNAVGPRYFETIGLPLLLGRDFRDGDNPATTPEPPDRIRSEANQPEPPGPRVVIVSESVARRFFGGRNPIGSHICFEEKYDPGRAYKIIGVVKDAHYLGLREAAEPMVYMAMWRQNPFGVSLCLRTRRNMADLVGDVRRLVTGLDPAVPVMSSRTMQQQINRDILTDRLIATLSSFFGFLALLLAAVGLYGVISYSVARRTREIGIRMALGASRSAVLRLVVRDAVLLIMAGAAVGIPAALAASTLVKSFLFGINAQDPVTIAEGTAVLAAAAALACLVPVRRATRVDPLSCLRYE